MVQLQEHITESVVAQEPTQPSVVETPVNSEYCLSNVEEDYSVDLSPRHLLYSCNGDPNYYGMVTIEMFL